MADLYEPGMARIYYKSAGFRAGVLVTVDMLLPDFEWVENIRLQDVDGGVYFFLWYFKNTGSYLGVFKENGVKTFIRQFEVRYLAAGTGTSRRTGSGDNLINL